MFATPEVVRNVTDKVVDASLVKRAQYVIETYIGKFESEISNTKDLSILERATAYQAAYMLNNEDMVYEQMSASTVGQNEAYTTFKQNDNASPWVAPLAVMICNKLSFMRSRNVYTGKNVNEETFVDWRTI